MVMSNDQVYIGKVLRPHGLMGEVIVFLYADSSDNFVPGEVVTLRKEDRTVAVTIKSIYKHKSGLRVFFEGIQGRLAAEEISKSEITMSKSSLHELSNNEFYVFDLVGCKVFDLESEELGLVEEIVSLNGNDLMQVKDGGAGFMVPVAKQFVREINIQEKRITVDLPEGLIDE